VGTPAVTTRGFRDAEMDIIARLIGDVLRAPGDEGMKERVRGEVAELCGRFPVPGIEG
jgi:glycine hydroxymethyltransferase